MIRKMLVVAAAIAMPVSVIAASGVTAGAAKGPSAATDTAVCTGLTGTVTFSQPLTNAGYTSGVEVASLSGSLSGCTASGAVPVSISGASFSGTFSGKAGSAKHPSGQCTGLLGTTKQKGSLTTSWSSSPGVPSTVLSVKTVSGAVSGSNASFTVNGSYKGSFGGSDKGKTSVTKAQTVETVSTLAADCGGSGISVIHVTAPTGSNPVTLQ